MSDAGSALVVKVTWHWKWVTCVSSALPSLEGMERRRGCCRTASPGSGRREAAGQCGTAASSHRPLQNAAHGEVLRERCAFPVLAGWERALSRLPRAASRTERLVSSPSHAGTRARPQAPEGRGTSCLSAAVQDTAVSAHGILKLRFLNFR